MKVCIVRFYATYARETYTHRLYRKKSKTRSNGLQFSGAQRDSLVALSSRFRSPTPSTNDGHTIATSRHPSKHSA